MFLNSFFFNCLNKIKHLRHGKGEFWLYVFVIDYKCVYKYIKILTISILLEKLCQARDLKGRNS